MTRRAQRLMQPRPFDPLLYDADPPLYDANAIGERLDRARDASFARVREAVRAHERDLSRSALRAHRDARRDARAPQELTDPEPLENFDD